jgi:SAM-dependent methyltransferase
MNRAYYKEYYHLERQHWWFKVREQIIVDRVKQYATVKAPLHILNIGSATGRTSEALQPFGEVLSVEYDRECFLFCKEELKLKVIQASITHLPLESESFDLVCAFDVIEHVEDDALAVCEMMRVCKPGGNIFVTVPALPALWSHHDVINHHYRRYTQKQLEKLFIKPEGNILKNSFFNTLLFFPIYLFRKMQSLVKRKQEVTSASDFDLVTSPMLNGIFKLIFSLERKLLRYFSFPVGVSLLLIWRKK